MIIAYLFLHFFWFFGINGSSVVGAVFNPVLRALSVENMQAFKDGHEIDPIPGGASAAMANGGVAAFVKSAAIDFTQGIRINCVSPNVLVESYDKFQDSFRGFVPVPAERVAMAFVKSVEGKQTGQEYQVY